MRVGLDDFNDIPDPDDNGQPNIRFVPLDEFIDTEEETATPLLGTQDETVLPADGTLLMYGDGGAGKTTLSVDAIAHLGAGAPWLNITVPRPARITIIENEGPRAKFRQLLRQKRAAWNGGHDPFTGNTTILEEPWTKFTLGDDQHRLALAHHISIQTTDIVVMGPLVTLGIIGAGTPEDVKAFEDLMSDLRHLTSHHFALWLIHHENKAGDVSGAWERVPDTMCHVQAQGNGHTRLYWRKVRWSSAMHGTTQNLLWGEGRTYIIDEPRQRDIHTEILELFGREDRWRTVREVADQIEAGIDTVRPILVQLVERGELNYQQGPPGRRVNAKCWRLDPEEFPF